MSNEILLAYVCWFVHYSEFMMCGLLKEFFLQITRSAELRGSYFLIAVTGTRDLLIVILQGPWRVSGAGQALSRSSIAFTVSRHMQRYFNWNLLIYLLFVQCNVWHWIGNKIIVCQCIRPPSVFARLIYLRTTCSINIDINIYIWL